MRLSANPATALQPGRFEDSFHPKRCQNDAQGAQNSMKMKPGAPKGGPMSKKSKKNRFFGPFPPPIWAPILRHFRLKMRKSDKVTAFGGDLEPTHVFSWNFAKTWEPRTSKMCLKHSKYAVRCKVGFLQTKSSKWPPRAPFWRPLGSLWRTLGTKGHPRGHFLRGWNFDAKTDLGEFW